MAGNAYTATAVPSGGAVRRLRPDGPGASMLAALACAIALVAVWLVATRVPAARVRDAAVLGDFIRLNNPSLESVGNFLLHLLTPSLFIIWAAIVIAVALARSRPGIAVAAAAVMAFAPLTADTLKPILAYPHIGAGEGRINPASWPSGHATGAFALFLCALFVTPRRWRPVVAGVGGVYVLAVATALLVLAWHMPSDVVGGFLVATLWGCLALTALRLTDRRRGRPAPPSSPRASRASTDAPGAPRPHRH